MHVGLSYDGHTDTSSFDIIPFRSYPIYYPEHNFFQQEIIPEGFMEIFSKPLTNNLYEKEIKKSLKYIPLLNKQNIFFFKKKKDCERKSYSNVQEAIDLPLKQSYSKKSTYLNYVNKISNSKLSHTKLEINESIELALEKINGFNLVKDTTKYSFHLPTNK